LHNPVVPPLLGVDIMENSHIYCCVFDHVYRAVVWQRVDQIRYNLIYQTIMPSLILNMRQLGGKLTDVTQEQGHAVKAQSVGRLGVNALTSGKYLN
jgi:hypothetical protein